MKSKRNEPSAKEQLDKELSRTDLADSEKDRKSLEEEPVTLDLPDVEDIPGQEHIKPPYFGEFADTTISSDDEEGAGLFDEVPEDGSDVSGEEKKLLRRSAATDPSDPDEQSVRATALDRTDNEGDPLNEGNLVTDRFGEDLDLPESEETTEED